MMHGSLFHGFKQFVVARDGAKAWSAIAKIGSVGGWYHSTGSYPDDEMTALVQATAAHQGRQVPVVLEDFGVALVPTLMSLYKAFVIDSWRTLDLLLNVESIIHRTVRIRDREAHPPHLRPRRVSADEVHIEYASQRRLCAVAIGICRGVADYYGESVVVDQPECMERGASTCRIIVRVATARTTHQS